MTLRDQLIAVLDPWEVFQASDGHPALRTRTAEQLADAVLTVLSGVPYMDLPGPIGPEVES